MSGPAAGETRRIRSYYGKASWRWSQGRDLLLAERRQRLEQLVAACFGRVADLRICDVGCGGGSDLARWSDLGVPAWRLFGTELVAERAEAARRALPRASIATVNGFDIPYPDHSVDVVTASLVLSSIVDAAGRRALLAEMRRVAGPTGLIAIYDFRVRKPWNRNVVAISRRELAAALGAPSEEHRLGPFLPLLDVALKLPPPLRGAAIKLLPRTHRLWIWRPA